MYDIIVMSLMAWIMLISMIMMSNTTNKMEGKTMTLRELIDEYGANGVIQIDEGNGSAGPAWIEWDEDASEQYGDTEMHKISKNYNAYAGGGYSEHTDSFLQVARYVLNDYDTDVLYASDWIDDDERNAPYQATNPYRYRLIF